MRARYLACSCVAVGMTLLIMLAGCSTQGAKTEAPDEAPVIELPDLGSTVAAIEVSEGCTYTVDADFTVIDTYVGGSGSGVVSGDDESLVYTFQPAPYDADGEASTETETRRIGELVYVWSEDTFTGASSWTSWEATAYPYLGFLGAASHLAMLENATVTGYLGIEDLGGVPCQHLVAQAPGRDYYEHIWPIERLIPEGEDPETLYATLEPIELEVWRALADDLPRRLVMQESDGPVDLMFGAWGTQDAIETPPDAVPMDMTMFEF